VTVKALSEADNETELSDYDLKRLMEAERTKKKKEEENAVLKTKELREKERLEKLSKIKRTYIRVRFPDMVELQGELESLPLVIKLIVLNRFNSNVSSKRDNK